ncbi:hypothetical protein EB796_016627 [Bugula neritina]|uniref:Uncharacterized protein n=1 Tax=Bugula neritina TaxID=10212 RepID=A0A7J7JI68_BUGNE|nr:hypothetical protein EB796_016627 [Bugula neritina]
MVMHQAVAVTSQDHGSNMSVEVYGNSSKNINQIYGSIYKVSAKSIIHHIEHFILEKNINILSFTDKQLLVCKHHVKNIAPINCSMLCTNCITYDDVGTPNPQ